MRLAITFAVVLASAAPAWADGFAVMGPGAGTCVAFANQYKGNPDFTQNLHYAWAQGYMSGLNISSPGRFRDMRSKPVSTQQRFIRDWCDAHPLKDYMDAAMALYLTLPFVAWPK